MGTLAIDSPKSDRHLSGVLVKRNFNYHLVAPSDLNKYTDLVMSTINQKLSVYYAGNFDDLMMLLADFGCKELECKNEKKKLINVQDIKLELNTEDKHVILEWTSSPITDMHADSIIALIYGS